MNNTHSLLDSELDVINALKQLKWYGFANAIYNQIEQPEIFNKLTFVERINIAINEHIDYLHLKKSQSLLKKSKLKGARTIDLIDANDERGLSHSTLAEISTLGFIARKQNLIIRGASGTGKTELICALGKLACSRAISTEYITASDIMELSAAKDIADRHKFRDRLKKIKLLIIDDLFLTDFSDTTYAKYLHDVIDDRMGSTSTIFATQLTDAGIASRVKNIDVPVADALVRRIKNCAFDIVLQPQQLIAHDGAKYA